jgi:hypothetical protein
MNQRTAGGHPVHRVARPTSRPDEPEVRRHNDPVPAIERYQDIAAHMHRCAQTPRGDRYLIGCLCGFYTLTAGGTSSAAASLRAQEHVIGKAQEMMDILEPKDPDEA